MQNAQANQPAANPTSKQTLIFVLLVIVLAMVAAYVISTNRDSRTNPLPPGTSSISHTALEEKYGLHVNLIAVTGAGGFVDVRLKILDAEKARALLQDSKNFPSLFVDHDTILTASQAAQEQEIRFVDNGNLFIMFPNAGNAARPGTRLQILFGDVALEPTDVQ